MSGNGPRGVGTAGCERDGNGTDRERRRAAELFGLFQQHDFEPAACRFYSRGQSCSASAYYREVSLDVVAHRHACCSLSVDAMIVGDAASAAASR